MKKFIYLIYLFPIISLGQTMTIEKGFTSIEILPSGIRTFNGTNTTNSNVTLGLRNNYPFTSSSSGNVQFGSGNFTNTASGIGNIGIGGSSLSSFISGDYNIGIGYNTLTFLEEDSPNIAIGSYNASALIEGKRNLIFGSKNLERTDKADDNILVGGLNMTDVTAVGSENLAIGRFNLEFTTGVNNIGLGWSALQFNNSGNENIAVGASSLRYSTSGISNIAIGQRSSFRNTDGSHNIAIGHESLKENTSGTLNIAIGSRSLENSLSSNCISIGREAADKVNNAVSRSISIGTLSHNNLTTGKDNLALGFWASGKNETGQRNIALGSYTLFDNTASDNIALGYAAGKDHLVGNGNIFIGMNADDNSASKNISNSAAIGHNSEVGSNNTYVLGNISTSSIGGYAGWTNYSDRRLKEDIVYTNTLGLDFINDLKTAKYSYKADTTGRVLNGLIAQDVEASLEKLDLEWSGLVELDDEQKTLTIAYNQLTIPLINATQELKSKLDKVKQQLAELEAENSALIVLNHRYDNYMKTAKVSKTTK